MQLIRELRAGLGDDVIVRGQCIRGKLTAMIPSCLWRRGGSARGRRLRAVVSNGGSRGVHGGREELFAHYREELVTGQHA